MKTVNDQERVRRYCQQVPILASSDEDLLSHVTLVQFEKGDFICHEGQPLDQFYFMMEGKAKVFTTQKNGKMLLLCFYSGFELLGEVEVLSKVPYTTTVKALSPVTCLALDKAYVEDYLLKQVDFVHYIAETLSQKLLRNTQNCSFNMLYPLDNRVATYILLSSEGDYFHANLTYLSELLATSYRHLTRVLAKFCDQGLLEKVGVRYLIRDRIGLEGIANLEVTNFGKE